MDYETAVWGLVGSFFLAWVGFIIWSRKIKKWSWTISIGGGFLISLLCFAATIKILMLVDSFKQYQQKEKFHFKQPADQAMLAQANAILPKLLQVCPGLDKYAADFSEAEVERSSMRDYDGGITFLFQVANQPQSLPAPLNLRSAGHNCSIDINKDGTMAYIGKSVCHSICDGVWVPNDRNLMGREFRLE